MTPSTLLAIVAIAAGGAAVATQAPINLTLARHAGDPVVAAMISFAFGTLVLLLVCGVRGNWAVGGLAAAPWWAWIGGAFGAYFVTAAILTVPRLGVVTAFAAMILGQMAAAMIIDSIGAFGVPVHSVNWQRVLAVAMVCGGVVLSRVY
jgi:transporter family-2 protein